MPNKLMYSAIHQRILDALIHNEILFSDLISKINGDIMGGAQLVHDALR